jgi:hypothetical protein
MVMPLFHVHGLMAGTFSPLAAGGAVVLPAAGKFSASVFWRDCVQHGATWYTAVPTMHQARRRARRAGLACGRACVCVCVRVPSRPQGLHRRPARPPRAPPSAPSTPTS